MKRGEKKDKTRFLFWVMILLCMWDATRFFTLFVLSLARQKYPNAHTANSKYSLLQSQCNNSFIFFFTFFYVNTAHPIVVSSVFFFFTFLLNFSYNISSSSDSESFSFVQSCFVFCFFFLHNESRSNKWLYKPASKRVVAWDGCVSFRFVSNDLFIWQIERFTLRETFTFFEFLKFTSFVSCVWRTTSRFACFFFFRFNQKLCTTLLR